MDPTAMISRLKTSPPPASASKWRRGPLRLNQMGRSYPLIADEQGFKYRTGTPAVTLAAYERAARQEPIIKSGLSMICLAAVGKLGNYLHPNKDIQKFIRTNFPPIKLKKLVYRVIYDCLLYGRYVGEPSFVRKISLDGMPQTFYDHMVHYHPTHVRFILNDSGVLTHGEKNNSNTLTKTGIWVPGKNKDLVRLPVGKFLHVTNGSDEIYGESILCPVLEYHLLKRAFIDLLAIALDRYGTPLIYAIVPPGDSDEVEEINGELRPKPFYRVVQEALEDIRSNNSFVFTQQDKDNPVQLQALTTGNNFSDAFQSAIDMCDSNMNIGLGIPNLIMKDSNQGLGSSGSSERQVEMFHHFVQSIFDNAIWALVDQVINPLIRYNFDQTVVTNSYHDGSFASKPIRWTETKVLIDAVSLLTDKGYIDSTNLQDANFVREMIFMPEMEQPDEEV